MKKFGDLLYFFALFFCNMTVMLCSTSDSMKILFLLNKFPVVSHTFMYNQITGMMDAGHEATIFSRNKGYLDVVHPNIKKYNLLEKTIYKQLPSLLSSYDTIFCQLACVGKDYIDLKKNGNFHGTFVVCFRGSDGTEKITKNDFQYQKVLEYADLLLPVCNHFKNILLAAEADPKKTIVHHSGINLQKFAFRKPIFPSNKNIKLVTIARLVEKKGLKYSIQAVVELIKKYPQLHYTVIGNGPLKQELETLIENNNAQSNITLIGKKTNDEVIKILNNSHIFILPSITATDGSCEGIPNVLMEAMAVGLPCISTDHGGIPELIQHNKTGFLVGEKAVSTLAATIEHLIENPHLWENITQQARVHVAQEHDSIQQNKKLEKLLKMANANAKTDTTTNSTSSITQRRKIDQLSYVNIKKKVENIQERSNSQPYQKKLSILFVTDKFPYESRPFINNQISGLIDRGHDLWILSSDRYRDTDMTPSLKKYDLESKIFYKNIPKKDFDIILCQFGSLGEWVNNLRKKNILSGKFVMFFRGEDISSIFKINTKMYEQLFHEVDFFLPVCDFFKTKLINMGCDPKKITTLHSAISCEQFPYTQHKFQSNDIINLITVARLCPKKGIEYTIQAIAQLKKKHPTITYTIIGSGRLKNNLQKLIYDLGAQEYIHMPGKLSHNDVAKFLEKSHIFILASVTPEDGAEEGIPNALMEAMASGLPAISTYHAGIPELVKDHESGLLVTEKNIDMLVEKIGYLIEHPDICVKMGKKGREYIEQNHNKNIENDKLEKILYKVINIPVCQ